MKIKSILSCSASSSIPTAPAGHYHLHLKVTNQAGKENEFEEHFDK
jgi:hypothetical protein